MVGAGVCVQRSGDHLGGVTTRIGASSLFVLNQQRLATSRFEQANARIAAGTSLVRAADNPSAIGRVERLKSLISEAGILNAGSTGQNSNLTQLSTSLNALATAGKGAGDRDALTALVAALQAQTKEVFGGELAFVGDPDKPEITIVKHAATHGTLTGTNLGASVNLGVDTYEREGSNFVGKSRVQFQVDGQSYEVKINSGTYTAATAATALNSAISSQTSAGVSVQVKDGALLMTSTRTGDTSSVRASGTRAATLGLVGGQSVNGANAYDEEVEGPAGPLTVTYLGREFTMPNLNKYADAITEALKVNDLTKAGALAKEVGGLLEGVASKADFVKTRLGSDSASRTAQSKIWADELGRLTGLNVAEETIKSAKAEVQLQQISWVLNRMQDQEMTQMRLLLGLSS